MRVLTLRSVSDEGEGMRVTIAPHHVKMVAAEEMDLTIGEQIFKKVNVVFMDGEILQFNFSMMDLITLEESVGTYFID